MADTTETTFRDLIVENRYKEMERNVKLARLKQIVEGGQQNSPVHHWPSLSSIHVDSMDSSYTTQSLRSFKAGSEIISSSTNMRNLVLRQQHPSGKSYSPTATSSVNKYPVEQKNLSDRDIMPPPSTFGISSRHTAKSVCETDASVPTETCSLRSQASDDPSSVKSTETNGNASRTFFKWKVMLNDQGQLIIKGIIDGGRVVRSRPVVRRLTATSVESINRCTYYLQGNIVDERKELPDYVAGKFYNGFPDDWENVYQVWKNFISQGCPVTFHWPTRVTDSDDDIRSELTDITYDATRVTKPPFQLQDQEIQPTKFFNKLPIVVDKTVLTSPQKTAPVGQYETSKMDMDRHSMQHSVREEKKDSSMSRKTQNYSLEEKMATLSPKSSKNLSKKCDVSDSQDENADTYMSRDSFINNLKHILLEVKWNTIINSISDNNCPSEYMDKVVKMYGILRDIISYEPVTEQDLLANTSHAASKYWPEDKSKAYVSHSQQNGSMSCDNNASSKRNIEDSETRKEHSQCSSDCSESETYAGVPKISLERVLQAQEMRKRTPRRNRPRPKRFPKANATEEEESLRVGQKPAKSCDSSITISEEENENNLNPRNQRMVSGKFRETSDDASMRNMTAKAFNVYPERTRNANDRARNHTDSCVTGTEEEKENDRGKRRERFHHQNEEPKSLHSKYLREMNKEETKNYRTLSAQKQPDETVVDSKLPAEKLSSRESTEPKKPQIISVVSLNPSITQPQKQKENMEGKDRAREHTGRDSQNPYADEAKSESGTKEQQGNAKPDTKLSKSAKTKSPNQVSTNTSAETGNKTASGNKLGTIENPYSLTAWVPKVVSTNHKDAGNDCRLVFEGKLLNETGHIVHHRYTTDFVSRRVHSKLVETVNKKYYLLIGDVADTKHMVPPELLKQCKNGCPAKIEQFCKAWKATGSDKVSISGTQLNHDTSMDMLSVSVSSRGRRTLPPLRYWMGERILVKDETIIYSPLKSSQDSSYTSGFQSPESIYPKSDKKPRSRSASFKKVKADSKSVPANSQVDKPVGKSTRSESSTEKPSEKNVRKVETKSNKRIAQQIHFSSDSSDTEYNQQQQKSGTLASSSEKSRKLRSRIKTPNSSPETEQKQMQQRRLRSSNEHFKEPGPQYKSKKRQKIDDTHNTSEQSRHSKPYATRQQPKSKSINGLYCSFQRGVPTCDDALSDLSQI